MLTGYIRKNKTLSEYYSYQGPRVLQYMRTANDTRKKRKIVLYELIEPHGEYGTQRLLSHVRRVEEKEEKS